MDSACLTYEGLPVSLYQATCDYKPPVWILGKQYDGNHEKIQKAVRSLLWLTYRKGFPAIGGTGPTSDNGWGCMLRSGQMILAEALIRRHLGRDWSWQPKNKSREYMMVLHSFMDQKHSFYSIHQIAQMGVSEGKAIGSWFGPNTVAQALRKLSLFDEWSNISIHVAMDNLVVLNDIRILCKSPSSSPHKKVNELSKNKDIDSSSTEVRNRHHKNQPIYEESCSSTSLQDLSWKPLLLFIPLRLGLSNMNPIYETSLQKCFTLNQSVGCIGGKPNHAAYFIGCYGNKLMYLDPHVTQSTVVSSNATNIPDETYHCRVTPPLSMNISDIDPSLALGFYCDTEAQFEELCVNLKEITRSSARPMFEIVDDRPPHLPPYQLPIYPNIDPANLDFESVQSEIDEEYEII